MEILIAFGLVLIFIIGYITGLITPMLLKNYFTKLNKQILIKDEDIIQQKIVEQNSEEETIIEEPIKTTPKVSLTDELIDEWLNGSKDGVKNE